MTNLDQQASSLGFQAACDAYAGQWSGETDRVAAALSFIASLDLKLIRAALCAWAQTITHGWSRRAEPALHRVDDAGRVRPVDVRLLTPQEKAAVRAITANAYQDFAEVDRTVEEALERGGPDAVTGLMLDALRLVIADTRAFIAREQGAMP